MPCTKSCQHQDKENISNQGIHFQLFLYINSKFYFTYFAKIIATIKNYSIEESVIKKFGLNNTEAEDSKFEADYILALANNMGALLSWFMQFAGVGMGLMMVIRGEILIGTVVASQSFASDLAAPL